MVLFAFLKFDICEATLEKHLIYRGEILCVYGTLSGHQRLMLMLGVKDKGTI